MKGKETRSKKIVITGGHLTPAQAVIEELKKKKGEIYYLGRRYSLEGKGVPSVESEVIPRLGVEFIPIPAGRLQRRWSGYTLASLLRVPFGFFYSFFLLLKIRPTVILSFGGYVSVPVVIAGWLLRTPILTHEQTVVSGLANQINTFFAQKILVSFPETLKYFPKEKVVWTGNPLRREIFSFTRPSSGIVLSGKNLPFIYITGGRQGAQVINRAVVEVLPELLRKYRLVHQCGKLDYQRLQAVRSTLPARLQKRYWLVDYIDSKDIGWVFHQAELVVSRAGANIVSELAALGKPAILIPIPWAYKNEQLRNAQMLVKAGTAIILPQAELSGKKLKVMIEKMVNNLKQYQANAPKAQKLVKLEAAENVVREVYRLLEA